MTYSLPVSAGGRCLGGLFRAGRERRRARDYEQKRKTDSQCLFHF
jgi:hypothetical protein